MKTINSSFLLGILNFFLYNLSLTFLSILQNPSYLEMFWKFPWPSQVGYQNILQLKGWSTSKVTPEDGWWFQAFQVSKALFLTFSTGMRHFVLWLGCLAGDKPSPSHLSQPSHPSQPSYPTYRRFIIVTLAMLVTTGIPVILLILCIPVIESFTLSHPP